MPSIQVRASGAPRNARIYTRQGGAIRPLLQGWVRVAGIWRQFYAVLSASIAPTSINTTANPSGNAICTVSGGTAPYSYSWTRLSGSTKISANAPSSSSTTFSRTGFAAGEIQSATFQCTVTDSGGISASVTILVTLTRPEGGS